MTDPGLVRLVAQIGFKRLDGNRRDGQRVVVSVNDVECSWHDNSGKYLTPYSSSQKGIIWYLWDGDLDPGDLIRIKTVCHVATHNGKVIDEDKTFASIYTAELEAPVNEIYFKGIGFKGYPLLKGRFTLMHSESETDKREASIVDFMRDDLF